MITERVQILLTPAQRRRLEEDARRQARSVASLVREAIDARFGTVSRQERIAAAKAIAAMNGGRHLTPEEINRAVEEEREAFFADH
jgi:predicted transcriptional regulator